MIQLRLLVFAKVLRDFQHWQAIQRLLRWYRGLPSFLDKCMFENESKSKRICTSKNEPKRSFTDHFEWDIQKYDWASTKEWWRLIRYHYLNAQVLNYSLVSSLIQSLVTNFLKCVWTTHLLPRVENLWSHVWLSFQVVSNFSNWIISNFFIFYNHFPISYNSKNSWILQWSNVFEESTFLEWFTHEQSQSFERNWPKTSLGHSK